MVWGHELLWNKRTPCHHLQILCKLLLTVHFIACYCDPTCTCSQIMHVGRALGTPKHHQYKLTNWKSWSEFFGNKKSCVLSMHALSFALGYVMMNPTLITCDHTIQEALTFDVIIFQVTGANVHMQASMLFCQLSGHPFCTNVAVCKAVVHYWMHWLLARV